MVLRAADAGWTIREVAVAYHPRDGALEGHRHGARNRPRRAGHDEMSYGDLHDLSDPKRGCGHATKLWPLLCS